MDSPMAEGETFECPICMNEYSAEALCRTACRHTFCTSCFRKSLAAGGPSLTLGSCPMCREPVSVYSAALLCTGDPLCQPRHEGIAAAVYVQHGGLGVASYHFGDSLVQGQCNAYIDYTNAPPSWRLDDGQPPPLHKSFVDASYDKTTRTFTGIIHWPAPGTFFGEARWEYEMRFDEGFGFIASGELRSYGVDGAFMSRKTYPDVLRYHRYSNPPTTIFGQCFVQGGSLGVASYHFEECNEASCENAYISYAAAPEEWRLDAEGERGERARPPARKHFEDPSYDYSTRTFRGTIVWTPPATFHGDSKWTYEMIFAEDFGSIVGGQVTVATSSVTCPD